MKRSLLNWVYLEKELKIYPVQPAGGIKRLVVNSLRKLGFGLHWRGPDPEPGKRLDGKDWPFAAHTMIGLKRLDNLQHCAEEVLRDNVPGDFMETGVWRGGASIFMRSILKAHNETGRVVWLADSFQGLPPPDFQRYPKEGKSDFYKWNQQLAVGVDEVQRNFDRYGLLDDQVKFLQGWFEDTLPSAPVQRLALLRLDGDMYGSTMVALTSLYPKLSPAGYIIIDDYTIPECQRAVHDYREKLSISEPITCLADGMGAYWRRSR
jgi:hypothetical protein